MQKIKVLHVIKSLGRGGAEMLLQETLKIHNKDKFEFHYIYFLPWKMQMHKGLEDAGGKVINIPANNNIQIVLQLRKLIRYVKTHNIDIIHCHLPWAGFVGRFMFKLINIPVIYSEHNIQDRYHIITATINKYTFNWQTKVIAVSEDVSVSIKKNIDIKIPIETVLNGVNTEYFKRDENKRALKRAELGIAKDDILIGNIAVFRFQKRIKEWVELFKIISDQFPNVKACVVGDGILKQEIFQHVKALKMENRILFPGTQTDVLPWLSAMDIFLMTSSFEGLPISLLEAMSMECAIVTTNAGGIKELIRDNEDGFIKPVNEWQVLKEPLTLLIQNPESIKAFGKKARSRVQESFSIKSMVCKIENIYFDIVIKK